MFGHDDARDEWRRAMGGERMHHGWLLAGRRGLGKMHFARAAAAELVGAEDAANHPDIIILSHLPKDDKEEKKRAEGKAFEVKRNISVHQIREMQRRLTTRPTLGDKRAIIIDPADDLEKSASNALLKSLEEPPIGTFFLLIAHRPARLLPTIRSRCRVLRFPALTDEVVTQILSMNSPEADESTVQAAVAAASGSPGAALEFVNQNLGKIGALMQQIALKGDEDFDLRGRLAAEIGARPNREKIQAILDLSRAILSGRMDQTARDDMPALVDAHADLVRLAGQAPTFNFDPGLLVMEVGGLLARAAGSRASANV